MEISFLKGVFCMDEHQIKEKIKELIAKRNKLQKELKSPFLNATLRTEYKMQLDRVNRDLIVYSEEFKKFTGGE